MLGFNKKLDNKNLFVYFQYINKNIKINPIFKANQKVPFVQFFNDKLIRYI